MDTQIIVNKIKEEVHETSECSIGAIYNLIEALQKDEWFKVNYHYTDNELYEQLQKMTKKQKAYIWVCVLNKRHFNLGDILKTLKINKR